MIEHIGAVELDGTYYPGEDLYCDGAVEDELLQIVTTCSEEDYNRMIAEKKDWAILYHLSHIRGNIVEWLPISREDSVLEIGSGCGAVTGTLSDKARKVDCIELSKKRSLINANRNRSRNNISIKLGNFQEVEKNLTEKYDWVTLIGVFEYGQGYIDSPNPYQDFLRTAGSHLKPGGKLVMAIENRLGLKYFAGCTEDHCGIPFEGIEGYRTTKGVRTFSRPELEKIMDEAGFTKREFYYPYPDYKLPMSIYSDQYLPKVGELRSNRNNFDRKRLQIFDESEAFDSIIESGLFPQFANSFLIVMEKEEPSNE